MTPATQETEDQRGVSRDGLPQVQKCPLLEPSDTGSDAARRIQQGAGAQGICLPDRMGKVESRKDAYGSRQRTAKWEMSGEGRQPAIVYP